MSEKQDKGQSSTLPHWLQQEVEGLLEGRTLKHVENIGKSDAEQMAILSFSGGTAALVKWNEQAPRHLFQDEAAGMQTLREAVSGELYVPQVLGFGDKWLMMEDVEEGEKEDAAAAFGRGLAELHKKGHEQYGYGEDNYLGPLMQRNRWRDNWVDFFREQRLLPALDWLADDKTDKAKGRRRNLEAVAARLEDLLGGADVRPSLLHGHLTGHSWMARKNGQAVLVDPAPYFGHREVDLAALRLMGEPPQTFWQAYKQVWPLDDGFETRMPVYQLVYALAHMAMGEDLGSRLDQLLEHLSA